VRFESTGAKVEVDSELAGKTMQRRYTISTALLLVIWGAAPAWAATVSGKISDGGGGGLQGMEVRLWAESTKGFDIALTETTASDGTYTFSSVSAGRYKLDARMAPGVSGNYGDRWYDVEMPVSGGLVGADADVLDIAANDTLTGLNITLEQWGGLDGRIVSGGTPVQDLVVRVESEMDHRIHHNDVTDGPCCGTNPHLGKFFMRGLQPTSAASTYRAIIYDPSGAYQTTVDPGPYTITSGTDVDAGDINVAAMPADPNEPNDSDTAPATPTIGALPCMPPSPTAVAPLGDVDYYCVNATAGDRLVASVQSRIDVDGSERPHPWFDPIVGLWDGSQITLSNDDAQPGETLDARLDTGNIASDGRYCFVVSPFGVGDFDGTGQGGAGEYEVEIEQGNRPPTLEVLFEGTDAPFAPEEIIVDEGEALEFVMNFTDPDGDNLDVEIRHFDNAGMAVTSGTIDEMANSATYRWTPSQQDGPLSPFELMFRINDGEFDLRYPVVVRVSPVSVPPTIPVLLQPDDESTVEASMVDLVIENSTDADGDSLTYDFQLEYGEPDNTAEDEVIGQAEGGGGMTSAAIAGLPENEWVHWRARAYDGADYSAWSERFRFFVDAENEPPEVPSIVKPGQNEQLDDRQPTIAATLPEDPEGDAVTLAIELATDEDFGDVVAASDPLEPGTDEMMIEWLVPDLLEWGGVYYVRAQATDERGATSAWSDPVGFSVRFENELMPPSFSGDFSSCEEIALDSLPDEIRVLNVDNQADLVTFDVQIVAPDAPEEPLFETSVPQSDAIETVVPVEVELDPGTYDLRVRAQRRDESTEWTACPFTLAGDDDGDGDGDGDSQGGEEGCGCATPGAMPGSLLGLLALLGLRRRRRR
jgi:MYXO-CTERM domain-containing protein